MKIENSNLIGASAPVGNPNRGGMEDMSGAAPATSKSDAVQISSLGSALHAASGKVFGNTNQIENLRSNVRSGAYTVDPLQLSRRIVNDSLSA
ncbi:MAG TPA: hypothetical protein VH325_16490 [Bryobacteraceae bacterium]|nr:hypothetical protein [Bryobacteraceae bacterium]